MAVEPRLIPSFVLTVECVKESEKSRFRAFPVTNFGGEEKDLSGLARNPEIWDRVFRHDRMRSKKRSYKTKEAVYIEL